MHERVKWLIRLELGIAVALTLVATSVPRFESPGPLGWTLLTIASAGVWSLVGLSWLVLLGSRLLTLRAAVRRERMGWRTPCALIPCVAVTTAVAVLAGWPLEVRLGLSRASFEADVASWSRELADGSGATNGSRALRLGLYWVRRSATKTAVYYKLRECNTLFGWGGFAYSPRGAPPEAIFSLRDGWYAWAAST